MMGMELVEFPSASSCIWLMKDYDLVSWEHREVPRPSSCIWLMKDYEVMVGWLEIMGFVLIRFGWGSIFISYISVYVLLCIAHPVCVCVAMIEYLVIREQMMWQVGQETHRLRAGASLGFIYILISNCHDPVLPYAMIP